MPECTRNALAPSTPAWINPSSWSVWPGTTPAWKPTSTHSWPRAAATFSRRAATVVVTGLLLSGMSTSVVTPPAAAAWVPVAKPSHSVRPGSFRWTWVSTKPGMTTRSPTSSTRQLTGSRS